MAVRLEPSDCTILVVNSAKFFAQFATADLARWLPKLAQTLFLPIRDVNFESHSKEEIQLVLNELSGLNTPIRRNKVLVAGIELEESVSLFTLEALAFGFEVFLLGDLIKASDERMSKYCWDRLVQAGAVPTTLPQVALELATSNQNSASAPDVKEMLSTYREMQLQHERPA
ncbi:MAG: isochorismatase family protein [Alphaproteobacteria bacterium]|nr:isochorismatase family protein [Alphaproteobacteria bacterium]